MTPPPPEDHDRGLRERVRAMGRLEAAGAPSLDRVLRGPRPAPAGPAAAGGRVTAGRRAAALAVAAVLLVAGITWWEPMRPRDGGAVAELGVAPAGDPAEGWDLPSDGLLKVGMRPPGAAGEGPDVERLSREIEGLLEP
jgi:hypothetical protein